MVHSYNFLRCIGFRRRRIHSGAITVENGIVTPLISRICTALLYSLHMHIHPRLKESE
jgi:hypothetical protein